MTINHRLNQEDRLNSFKFVLIAYDSLPETF
jgi:hypothetical protein